MGRIKIYDAYSPTRVYHKFQKVMSVLMAILISHTVSLENYDFIIVGGGTGGLAVARRLAEGGKHTVLVLESGGLPKEGMDVPAFAPKFPLDPDVTFQYRSTPQRNAGQRNNGIIAIFSGRMLSGTSNLNYMVINRGNPRDYDNWGNMTQDSSWNYSGLLKYFKKSETYIGDFPSEQHGFSGPITVSRPRYSPGLEQWLAAGKSLGYPIADPNGPQRRSFTSKVFAKRRGRRESAFTGYIQPILSSTPNLHIILNTNVTQIIFEGKHAVGVRFQSKSTELKNTPDNCLYANKEIIVSAGTYGSPILLMRSGIGPKGVLRAAGIPLVQELPVGNSFQDHVFIPMHIVINNRNLVMDEDRDLTPENWEYFNKFGDGPYSSTEGATGQAFAVSSVAKFDRESDWPDLHIVMSHSIQAYYSSGLMPNHNTSISQWEAPMRTSIYLTRPKSRGNIRLNPSNPDGPPILDVGYLSDERDIKKLMDGIEETLRIFEETPSYRKLGARFPPVDIPSCRQFPFRTDSFWRCYIRYTSATGCHPAGTCKMGRGASDPEALVDNKLKVIGIKGLRVADASIMPLLTNSNTQAAVSAIAEKASDMILNDW